MEDVEILTALSTFHCHNTHNIHVMSKLKLLLYMIRIVVNFTLCTNLTRRLTLLGKLVAKIIQAVQTFSATIGYLYFADLSYMHVMHSRTYDWLLIFR